MDRVWPEGIQCAVVLTFDLDAETLWFSRSVDSIHSPGLLSEGAYGPKEGVPRLLKMLERLSVKATFFVPGWVVEKYTELVCKVVDMGHEIGYHGYLHEVASSGKEEAELISKCKKISKDLLGIVPLGYRAPEAELGPWTLDLLANNGFEYSSNYMDADRPYLHEVSNRRSIVELPINWLFDDSSHFFFTLQDPPRRPIAPPSAVMEMWKAEFDGIYNEAGSMVLTMHPQIIGRTSRVRMLEQLVSYMKSKPGVLITSGLEVARAARQSLEVSSAE